MPEYIKYPADGMVVKILEQDVESFKLPAPGRDSRPAAIGTCNDLVASVECVIGITSPTRTQ
jgi:hypothetical protein